LTNKCGNKFKHENEAEGPRRIFCSFDHSQWETNLKYISFNSFLSHNDRRFYITLRVNISNGKYLGGYLPRFKTKPTIEILTK
jgi:hypothetical protein